jgi:uncharacterized protein (DUF2249 family)
VIVADTNLGRLLDEHPELVEFLASYHDHFGRLRNRLLRRVMAPRVTVAQAAAVAGVPAPELVRALRRAVGEPDTAPGGAAATPAAAPVARPAALDTLRAVDVDVRDDVASGREPFARIMAAAKALGAGEALALRVPFEPVPLYDVLGRRGLAHFAERLAADDWRVWFYRGEVAPSAAPAAPADDEGTIDVRGLEPPLPMVRVLERLAALPPGRTLVVLHERRPMFLYPQLDARGFSHVTDEPSPGVVRIVIGRPPAP